MIKQLAHICIHTNDLEKTENFYCNILGLSKKFNFDKDGNLFGFYIDLGNNTYLEFFHDPEVVNQTSSIRHFCLEVENITSAINQLNSNGIETTQKLLGCDKTFQCWITDPNGIQIELQEYTSKSSQINGGNCIVDW